MSISELGCSHSKKTHSSRPISQLTTIIFPHHHPVPCNLGDEKRALTSFSFSITRLTGGYLLMRSSEDRTGVSAMRS